MEQRNDIAPLGPLGLGGEEYVKKGLNPEISMANYFERRYLNYLAQELDIKVSCRKENIKEKIDELKPIAEQMCLQPQEIYTKNEKNKLKKILKYFLGEDGIKLLWVDKKDARSGYLFSEFDGMLLDMLLNEETLGTSNEEKVFEKLQEDKFLYKAIYKQFCTLAENKTNNLTKEFIDWRWSVLFNARFEKAMDALEDLRSTLFGLESIASDLECNIDFWDYVTEQIKMIHENIEAKKSQIVRQSSMSHEELQNILAKVEKKIEKRQRRRENQGLKKSEKK